MKTGLVLEGGGLRGLFTAGIMDVLMEHQIQFDGIIGVSAGAAFGCNYKSKQIGRVLRYNIRFAHDRRYCSLWSLLTTGDLYNGEFCYHELPELYDLFDKQTFNENPAAFYVVCTDVETGKAVYRQCMHADHDCYEWIRASASMPLVSKVVQIDKQKLLDGGIADSIPLQYFLSIGYERNLVILTQPAGYVKTRSPWTPLMRLALHRMPALMAAFEHRPAMYNAQLDYVREQGKKENTFVIRPNESLPINHISHNIEFMEQTYQMGRDIAEQELPAILDFLTEK